MLNFESDYIASAHPAILNRLSATTGMAYPGYGKDSLTAATVEKLRIACDCPEADVTFVAGGTQANALVISAMLKNYECVVAANTGHVNLHEAGAIEMTGHKVMLLPQVAGKISSGDLRKFLASHFSDGNIEQMVYPGMVYISYPTEYGTIYSAGELNSIYEVCREFRIPLFIDGARLGYGLMSSQSDVTLPYLAAHCDVFYIGGTKVGALFGEAIVFPKGNAPGHFFTTTKQRGALLAKGWINALQFDTFFTDNLYFSISRHADEMAEQLRDLLVGSGYSIFMDSPTNQQFIEIDDGKLKKLEREVRVCFWEKPSASTTAVRLATSWATEQEELNALSRVLKHI